MIVPLLEQKKAEGVDGHNLGSKDLDDLAGKFQNCSGELVQSFLGQGRYLQLVFRIFGASPPSLEQKNIEALALRGTEGDASCATAVKDAARALLPEDTGRAFGVVLEARTPRERAAKLQGVLDAHEAHVVAKCNALEARIRDRGTPAVPLRSPADAEARVLQLLCHAAEDRAAVSKPSYAVRKIDDEEDWGPWTFYGSQNQVKKALQIDIYAFYSIHSGNPTRECHADLVRKYQIEDYDPQMHGQHEEALVAADFVARVAPYNHLAEGRPPALLGLRR